MKNVSPVKTSKQVIPVAGYESMLLNLCGAHAPFFTRNLVLLTDSAGNTGMGEVPGGAGIVEALADAETLGFISRQAAGARYVTSVCIGAFLLGAVGLLRGRRATTHWAHTGLLPLVGATYEKARIVRDGNVFTSAGVSAGLDFAFAIIAELAGVDVAKAIQLSIEYDPEPPFDAGHPDKASKAATALMTQRNAAARAGIEQALGGRLASSAN